MDFDPVYGQRVLKKDDFGHVRLEIDEEQLGRLTRIPSRFIYIPIDYECYSVKLVQRILDAFDRKRKISSWSLVGVVHASNFPHGYLNGIWVTCAFRE